MLAPLAHFLLERLVKVLDVNFKDDAAAAEGVGELDLLEVIDAEEVGDGIEHPLPHVFDELGHLILLAIGKALEDDFSPAGVFVLVDRYAPEDLVHALL